MNQDPQLKWKKLSTKLLSQMTKSRTSANLKIKSKQGIPKNKSGNDQFECEICKKKFNKVSYYTKHVQNDDKNLNISDPEDEIIKGVRI